MVVSVYNAQDAIAVDTRRMAQVARCAIRQLCIRTAGAFTMTFIDARRMRSLNRRFLHRDRTTDVLSFRYDGEPVVGEMLISPRAARVYAKTHGLSYQQELARYVIHGLLHWMGHEDRTRLEQRRMRAMEDQLLRRCSVT